MASATQQRREIPTQVGQMARAQQSTDTDSMAKQTRTRRRLATRMAGVADGQPGAACWYVSVWLAVVGSIKLRAGCWLQGRTKAEAVPDPESNGRNLLSAQRRSEAGA